MIENNSGDTDLPCLQIYQVCNSNIPAQKKSKKRLIILVSKINYGINRSVQKVRKIKSVWSNFHKRETNTLKCFTEK